MSYSYDSVLSEFVTKTGCDPDIARDLLQNLRWDLEAAFDAYSQFTASTEPSVTISEPPPYEQAIANRSRAAESELSCGVPAQTHSGHDSEKGYHRGLSFSNSPVVTRLRDAVQYDRLSEAGDKFSDYSFVLPDFSGEDADYQEFLRKDLVNTSAQVALESAGCLNWWCSQSPGPARRLIPLATSGDGNCLLHAASLAMWGIHDRLLTLRQALQETLTDSPMAGSLRRRWTYDIEQRNKEAGGLVYSQMEWDREWNDVLRLSSCQERPSDSLQPHYESLEEIHVFALAHVLHRPLIVISDKYLRDCDNVPIAPIYFGGVYLPLERHPTKCFKTPLLLTYEASHFSALVSVESHAVEMMEPKKGLFPKRNRKKNPSAVVPLQLADGSLLPVHFSIDRENLKELASIKKTYSHLKSLDEMRQDDLETYHLKLMKKYLDVSEFDLTFVHEEQPGPPLSPVSLSADCKSVCSSEGSSVPLQGQHLQNSTVKANKRSFFSALAAGFRFGNNKLKLPPDTRALGSRLDVNKRPPHYDDLIANYLESAHDRFLQAQKKESQKERERESSRRQQEEEKAACETRHCQTVGCEMYGTAQTDFLCSHCYAQQLQHLGKTYQHPILIGTGSNHPTGLVRRDTSGLGGHYDFNQSSPSWTELASHPSVSRNKLLDLNQYAGYYPDSVQTATCDFPAHRSSISYPHTRSQIGFTDAGKQLETQYLNRTHRGRDRVSISQDDQCTHV